MSAENVVTANVASPAGVLRFCTSRRCESGLLHDPGTQQSAQLVKPPTTRLADRETTDKAAGVEI